MNILFAADGSKYTKKALAFLLANRERLLDQVADDDATSLHILNVQYPVPPRARSVVGKNVVNHYHAEEADKVLAPIRKFLDRHGLTASQEWLVGAPSDEILSYAKRYDAHMIVMGTHGHGVLGRILMGSVAQRVVTDSSVPVLLVK
jgi:nucleotide-binding universal stress UspA family protein